MILRRWKSAKRSILTWPDAPTWLRCAAVYLFALLALPLGFTTNFFHMEVMTAPTRIWILTPLILFIVPSTFEEFVFRILLIPRHDELVSRRALWFSILLSLALFIAMHPLNAMLLRPAARVVFCDPIFLTIATLLGIACTLAYRLSGSLWPSVVLHWLTVVLFHLFLGGQRMLNIH